MIDVAEMMLGVELGQTAYDDILLVVAYILGYTAILLIFNLLLGFLRRR